MRSPPLPFLHVGAVVPAKFREREIESLRQPRAAALFSRPLRVAAPFRPLRQYCLHYLGPQIPVIRYRVAEPAEQDRAAELAEPRGEQQRLTLVQIHAKVPAPYPFDSLMPGFAL